MKIADDAERAWPGDLAKGEIHIVTPGTFDEDGTRAQMLLDEVEFPNGKRAKLPRVTRSPKAEDGVIVAPIDEEDRIVLVHQFRHAVRRWTWELPRGASDIGQSPECALRAELLEEIGYQAIAAPLSLGRLMPDSATIDEMPYLYAVRVRPHPTKRASPESTEIIAGHEAISYPELWELCARGAINDCFTLAAVLRLHACFRDGRFVK